MYIMDPRFGNLTNSTFDRYDISEEAIDKAKYAQQLGNISFEVAVASDSLVMKNFDLVVALYAIHDQRDAFSYM